MSALARYFLWLGKDVSGYDRTETPLTCKLEEEGMSINYTDVEAVVPQTVDLVIYTPAIPPDNIQFELLKKRGALLLKRSEVLEIITKKYKVIAIAGTHGKTTITSMLSHIFKETGMEFMSFIGGIPANYNTNFLVSAKPQWAVVEADEYDRSFLKLQPDIALITSMDADHLDVYGDMSQMLESFQIFARNIKGDGSLVVRSDLNSFVASDMHHITYGLEQKTDFTATGIRYKDGNISCTFHWNTSNIGVVFDATGKHNLENALAAFSIAVLAEINPEKVVFALKSFKGVKRRFEKVLDTSNLVYIDDYAHHPEELKACITSARELYPGKKITGVFQPHLFSRTRDLAVEFGRALSLLDVVAVMDIYPARELPVSGVDAHTILKHIQITEKYHVRDNDLLHWLSQQTCDVLLTLGAGNIDRFVEPVKDLLQK